MRLRKKQFLKSKKKTDEEEENAKSQRKENWVRRHVDKSSFKKKKKKSYWLQKEAGPQMTPKILNKNISRTFEKYNYMLIQNIYYFKI